jgi:DNA-binding LacI/PurR family transcriptional regulator
MTAKELVRLRDVAAAAGVSQGTASNVFNRPELVREEVRDRVLKAAQKLGYSGPNVAGRLLRAGKVNAIGVAAVEPLSYFFEDLWARDLLSHISRICDAQGTGVALVSALTDERIHWNIQSAVVDGFILLCVEGDHALVTATRTRNLPFVTLVIGSTDDGIPGIGVDNERGGYDAARHLIDLGHRRLAIVAMPLRDASSGPVTPEDLMAAQYSATRMRAVGYWRAAEEAGIGRETIPAIETLEGDDGEASVHEAMSMLFDSEKPPTAILAMSDRIAMQAIDWLFRSGRSVPGEVSVIGFDGVPESAVSTPKLTTIEQPIEDIARLAVDAALGGKPVELRRVLPGRLVVRETTARPRQ